MSNPRESHFTSLSYPSLRIKAPATSRADDRHSEAHGPVSGSEGHGAGPCTGHPTGELHGLTLQCSPNSNSSYLAADVRASLDFRARVPVLRFGGEGGPSQVPLSSRVWPQAKPPKSRKSSSPVTDPRNTSLPAVLPFCCTKRRPQPR